MSKSNCDSQTHQYDVLSVYTQTHLHVYSKNLHSYFFIFGTVDFITSPLRINFGIVMSRQTSGCR